MATGVTGYYYGYQGISGSNINQVKGITFSFQNNGTTGATGTTGMTGTTGTTGMTGMTGSYQGNTGAIYFGTHHCCFGGAIICNNQINVKKINQVWKFPRE